MIDKLKACTFTGHRIVPKSFNKEELKKSVNKAINLGFDTFLCGMALGFDALCFSVLEEFKKTTPISIIACIPCSTQSKFFKKKQKLEYERMLNASDQVIYVSNDYFEGCMQKRNEFMVDNSSLVISYLNYGHGGTYNTVKYAVQTGVEVWYLGK